MRQLTIALFVGLAVIAGSGPSGALSPDDLADAELAALKARIEKGDAASARPDLQRLLDRRPDDADVLNLLGFASRRMADFDAARGYYDRALAINPSHRGALEYLGELELQLGHRVEAAALEARLAALCPDGCEELDDLRAAIAASGN